MSKLYCKRPSEIINIYDDEYASYCFDKACAYIIVNLENEKRPIYDEDREYGKKFNPVLADMMAGKF